MKGNRLYVVRFRERNGVCRIKTFDTLTDARAFFQMAKGILDSVFVELMSVMETWPEEATQKLTRKPAETVDTLS